jgi:hypothetical protein
MEAQIHPKKEDNIIILAYGETKGHFLLFILSLSGVASLYRKISYILILSTFLSPSQNEKNYSHNSSASFCLLLDQIIIWRFVFVRLSLGFVLSTLFLFHSCLCGRSRYLYVDFTSCFALFCSKALHAVVFLTLSLCRENKLWLKWFFLLDQSSLMLIYWCFSTLVQMGLKCFVCHYLTNGWSSYFLGLTYTQRHNWLYQLS